MQWSEVTKPPAPKVLRQFGALCLVLPIVFSGWRAWRGQVDAWTLGVLGAGVIVGAIGLVRPMAIRYLFTGWMIVAFPIGWTVSKIVLGLLFFGMFTPVALLFRLSRRDALRLRRPGQGGSLWADKPSPGSVRDYFRQF